MLLEEEVKNFKCIVKLLFEVNLGVIVIGIGLNMLEGYFEFVVKNLVKVINLFCVFFDNLIEVIFDCGVYVMVYGVLKCLVVKFFKVCNDLRLFLLGLCVGLNEINLLEL